MQKFWILWFLIVGFSIHAQQSDFSGVDFSKADNIALRYKSKKVNVNKISFDLTKDLKTDIEKFRAIYMWITHNIANDHRLFLKNNRKRNKYFGDSIALATWNSKFKKVLFKKLLRKRRTICSGYSYLLKEMCELVGIKARIINGFGKTSDVELDKLLFANHTWNAVQLNGKWYLCDPTWAAGITLPDKGRFNFEYNNGYFLADPKLFVLTHYPIERQWSLLGDQIPSFQDFASAPLLYGEAYNLFTEHISPIKMHDTIQQKNVVEFKYRLKKAIYTQRLSLVFVKGVNEKIYKPSVNVKGDTLTLQQPFNKRGFYDIHLYFDKKIVATYTFRVTK